MTDSLVPDPSLIATVDSFFAASEAAAEALATELTGALPGQLWSATHDLGLTLVGIEEDRGGSGGSLFDLVAILMSAGRHAVALPLAETHLAGWLLSRAGQHVPSGPMTCVPGHPDDTLRLAAGRLEGVAHLVPWASQVDHVTAVVEDETGAAYLVAFDPSGCRVRRGTDLAGQPCDTVEVSDPVCPPIPVDPSRLQQYGALLRSAQMAGAMDGVARLTQRYVRERHQFGRPIGAFQAVQHHVVAIAQAAEISAMCTWRAAAAWIDGSAGFEACAAKLVADEQARIAVRAAHQAHGAIGMTREYPLHLFTRRLNAWRLEFGTELRLSVALGAAVSSSRSLAGVVADHVSRVEVPWRT